MSCFVKPGDAFVLNLQQRNNCCRRRADMFLRKNTDIQYFILKVYYDIDDSQYINTVYSNISTCDDKGVKFTTFKTKAFERDICGKCGVPWWILIKVDDCLT